MGIFNLVFHVLGAPGRSACTARRAWGAQAAHPVHTGPPLTPPRRGGPGAPGPCQPAAPVRTKWPPRLGEASGSRAWERGGNGRRRGDVMGRRGHQARPWVGRAPACRPMRPTRASPSGRTPPSTGPWSQGSSARSPGGWPRPGAGRPVPRWPAASHLSGQRCSSAHGAQSQATGRAGQGPGWVGRKRNFFESDSEAGWLGPRRPAAGEREMESVVQTRGTQPARKDRAGEAAPFCLSRPTLVQIPLGNNERRERPASGLLSFDVSKQLLEKAWGWRQPGERLDALILSKLWKLREGK